MSSGNSIVPRVYSCPQDVPGWYGKIPSLGDFISRRLPASFVNTWDSWLQGSLNASRAQLGERWLDRYLTGPIWRFAVMPDALSATSGIWAGVLMPSVDKVGRYFPLTIALNIDFRPGMMFTVLSAQAWYGALERTALATLNIDALPDDLDRNLAENPFPLLDTDCLRLDAQELGAWWERKDGPPKVISLSTENSLTDLFEVTAESVLTLGGLGKSFWWALSGEGGPAELHCFRGLPPENYFATMLTKPKQVNP
jgi:type VI secretion system protein ImpM